MGQDISVPPPGKAWSRRVARLFPPRLRELSRGVIPLFLALGLLNASNYIFHVAVSRLLGPSEYGTLAALLALVMILSVPLSVAQTVVAKRVAILRTEGKDQEASETAAGAAKALLRIGLVSSIALAALSPLLASFLHTPVLPTALVAPYFLFSILLSVPLGVLQGRLRFSALAAVGALTVLVRLAVGVGLVAIGFGVTGAILGTVLGQGLSLLVAVPLLGFGRSVWRGARRSAALLRGEFAPALFALGAFWLLAEVDILMARRYLDPVSAGHYASAGLLSRALLFLPAAISMVALPRFAEARDGDEARRRLRLALWAVLGLVVLAFPFLVVVRGFAVNLAFGADFAPAASLIPLLAAGMGSVAIVGLLTHFHIAEGTRAYRLTFAAIAVETFLIILFHGNAYAIGWIVLGVGSVTAVVQYQAAVAACRWRPTGAVEPGAASLHKEGTLNVTVVLPCHNAEAGLRGVIQGVRQALEHHGSWEIIVVSDGSTDDTITVAESFADENIRVVHEPMNIGKGHALRVGLGQARGKYVAFMDADGDIDPRGLGPALTLMDLYEPDVILGSKRHPLSEVQYPALRRLLSWTYQKICRVLFRVNVRDTQTGFKLIRRDVLAAVLPRMLEKRYAFDLEFLVVARMLGFRRVFEAPVRIDYRFESQVKPTAAYRILMDTLAIAYRRYVIGTYSTATGALSVTPWSQPAPVSSAPRLFEPPGGTDRLRILFINWRDVRNPDAGGAEAVTHEVAKRWVAAGHEVTLFTSRFTGGHRFEVVDGVRIRRMGTLRRGTFHLRIQMALATLRRFDVVIDEINTLPFLTPLWRRRLPTTIALIHQLAQDVWDAETSRPIAALGRRIEPRLLRLYANVPIITVSKSTRDDLVSLGLRRVEVIPNGRDEPPEMSAEGKEADPTFLYVGRLTPNKRPDHAVEAFRAIRATLPSARLWIIGRGPMTASLAATLPAGAEMLGHVSRTEMYERMARAHCLLVPSVREGWGLVVVEANGVGTPAVGYDAPGIRDSVRDGITGRLAPPGDAEDLGRIAAELVVDGERYEEMRRRARDWAQEFSWDRTAAAMMAIVVRETRSSAARFPESPLPSPPISVQSDVPADVTARS